MNTRRSSRPELAGLCLMAMIGNHSGEAVTQVSLGQSPRNSAPRREFLGLRPGFPESRLRR